MVKSEPHDETIHCSRCLFNRTDIAVTQYENLDVTFRYLHKNATNV
jgi:hypothetical protein